MVLAALIAASNSCTVTKKLTNKKFMNQVYYTEEGAVYKLRTISDAAFFQVLPASPNLSLSVGVNLPPNTVSPVGNLRLNTSRKIIPLMFSAGMTDLIANLQIANIQRVFFRVSDSTGATLPNSVTVLMKNIANMGYETNNLFDSPNEHLYGIKYNQCVYKESDFLQFSSSSSIDFTRTLAESLSATNLIVNQIPYPASTYSYGFSFLYFELQ